MEGSHVMKDGIETFLFLGLMRSVFRCHCKPFVSWLTKYRIQLITVMSSCWPLLQYPPSGFSGLYIGVLLSV